MQHEKHEINDTNGYPDPGADRSIDLVQSTYYGNVFTGCIAADPCLNDLQKCIV